MQLSREQIGSNLFEDCPSTGIAQTPWEQTTLINVITKEISLHLQKIVHETLQLKMNS